MISERHLHLSAFRLIKDAYLLEFSEIDSDAIVVSFNVRRRRACQEW